LTGQGSFIVSEDEQRGTVEFDDLESITTRAASGPVELSSELPSNPGELVGENRRGVAAAADDSWTAFGCISDGRTGFTDGEETFHAAGVTVYGPSRGSAAMYYRSVYSNGRIAAAPDMAAWIAEDSLTLTRDRFNGSFQNRVTAFCNMREAQRHEADIVAVNYEGPGLDELQSQALWMLASFLSGRRVKQLYIESFDADGTMIERDYRHGGVGSTGSNEPFHQRFAPLQADYLEVIGDGFVRALRGGFPIGVILHHLHSANEGNPEADAQSLLLAIHTAFEAWNRRFGVRELADTEIFRPLCCAMLALLEPLYATIGPEWAETVRNKIRSSNNTSTNYRERDLFQTLSIVLDERDRSALASRNQLLHNGYFLRRWHELSDAERQERVDMPPRLRNLVHQVILKLVGFRGTAIEATRYGSLQIESSFCPRFG